MGDREKREVVVRLDRGQRTGHIEDGIRARLRFDGTPTVGELLAELRKHVPEGFDVEEVLLGNVTAAWDTVANEEELARHRAWRAASQVREDRRVGELAHALEAYHDEHPRASYEDLTREFLAGLRYSHRPAKAMTQSPQRVDPHAATSELVEETKNEVEA